MMKMGTTLYKTSGGIGCAAILSPHREHPGACKGPRIRRSMEPFVACRPHRETGGSEVQVLMSPLSPVLWTSLDCESLINLYQIHEDTVPVLHTNVGTCWNQVRRFRFSACVISLLLSSCIITGRALVRCTFANLGFNCFNKSFKDKNDNVTT